MRKTSKKASEAAHPAQDIAAGLKTIAQAWIENVGVPDIAELEEAIDSMEEEIEVRNERIEQYRARIEEAKRPRKMLADTRADVAYLLKNKKVHGVRLQDGNLIVTTVPLYADIRENEDSATLVHRCIGMFDIVLKTDATIQIYNHAFRAPHNHWSIKGSGLPCWGDWINELRRLQISGQVARVFDLIIPYLESTADGAAYMRAHTWIDSRSANTSDTLAVGDYVLYEHRAGSDRLSAQPVHAFAKVIVKGDTHVSLQFIEWVSGHNGSEGNGLNGHCWNVPHVCCTKVDADYAGFLASLGNVRPTQKKEYANYLAKMAANPYTPKDNQDTKQDTFTPEYCDTETDARKLVDAILAHSWNGAQTIPDTQTATL